MELGSWRRDTAGGEGGRDRVTVQSDRGPMGTPGHQGAQRLAGPREALSSPPLGGSRQKSRDVADRRVGGREEVGLWASGPYFGVWRELAGCEEGPGGGRGGQCGAQDARPGERVQLGC